MAKVPGHIFSIALSTATDTLYATQFNNDNNVAMINAATCNATVTTGCGHVAGTLRVGFDPTDVEVDNLTHTVYVAEQ